MTTVQEQEFEQRLNSFRKDVESATQFFYSYLAIHAVAGEHKELVRLLNTAPFFWNTILGALQKSTFIALGRVFDSNGLHNLSKLLGHAEDNQAIFSKQFLALRKQGNALTQPVWIKGYLNNVYEPTKCDFQRLRRNEAKWQKIYLDKYRPLRSKVFAHNVIMDSSKVAELFGKTNIREMQHMLVFLRALYEALWELYHNGRKPVLLPQRYSVQSMLKRSLGSSGSRDVQERIVAQAQQFLLSATSAKLEP